MATASYPQPFPSWPPPSGGYPVTRFEDGPLPGSPFPNATFPIPGKNYIDGLGTQLAPSGVTRVMGGLGN